MQALVELQPCSSPTSNNEAGLNVWVLSAQLHERVTYYRRLPGKKPKGPFVNSDSGLLLSMRTLQLRTLYFCFHRSIWPALGHGARDRYDRHNKQTQLLYVCICEPSLIHYIFSGSQTGVGTSHSAAALPQNSLHLAM